MATVTPVPPGPHEAVPLVLGSANSWTQLAAKPMTDLVEHLTVAEAENLPEAIAGVLSLLRQDHNLLRLAAEIAARFGFFEVAETEILLNRTFRGEAEAC